MQTKIDGFNNYRVDAILKFGGSLTRDLSVARALIDAIIQCRAQGWRVIVVPGGGRTDKTIEALDREQPLAPDTAHRACALAQDQTGLILCDPGFSDQLVPCDTITGCIAALDAGKVAVLLPSRIILDLDPVEKTWDITSDAVAAWVAWLVHASRLSILTDVDGIYADGHVGEANHLIRRIGYQGLLAMGHTSIDKCAAAFIARHGIEGSVLNGAFPDRLGEWLNDRQVCGTCIGEEAGAAPT